MVNLLHAGDKFQDANSLKKGREKSGSGDENAGWNLSWRNGI
jgi:hypothetical protein